LKLFAFTLDLEAEYACSVDGYELFKDHAGIENILSGLQSLGVKTTVFIPGIVLDRFPDVIKIFEKHECEFEAHSYSHDCNRPDTEDEIELSREVYFKYFGRYPTGYRAPQGRISGPGIKALEKQGFLYDSSIFPSYFPDPFKYLFCKRDPHYFKDSKIMEIPLTSISPLRLTLNIGYIKLFGLDFYMKLIKLFSIPDTICTNSHLHDFIHCQDSFGKLSPVWQFIFGRNRHKGIEYSMRFLEFIKQEGYRFCYMSEMFALYKDRLP
jgi:hypothetical protein